MVKASSIIQSNARFARQNIQGVVCVFAGATSGIGARALERMLGMFSSGNFYVLGRSPARFEVQRKTLESFANPACKIIFVEADVSLISDIDSASHFISAAEQKVDYLCMSMGGIPMNGAENTKEGLESCFTLSYYSRMRLLSNMLPLLRRSQNPRVLSVLNGGKEKYINEQDIGLNRHWSLMNVIKHTTLLNSLAFDYLAVQNEQITFIHNFPSLVKSDNFRRINPPAGSSLLRKAWLSFVKGLVAVIRYFVGMTPEEAGERQAYHLTSPTYGPGSLRVTNNSETVPASKALKHYQDNNWPTKVWEFTMGVWEKALATDTGGSTK
ncbi:hypothetical protein F5Y10DRAFT_102547 [Nemania abortiva]|nr:hypothetical protein F5Y10DRAFT_102547 [Nemania abortiva]